MNFIKFNFKYAEALTEEKDSIRDNLEISYEMEESYILKMKNGYREMGEFNQQYSEIGLSEDIKNLILYEDGIIKEIKNED